MSEPLSILQRWLMKKPRPATVRIRRGAEVEIVKCGGQTWPAVATTIEALDPEKIDALSEDGEVLRSSKISGLEPEEPEEPAPITKSKGLDGNQQFLSHMAELLCDAYKHQSAALDAIVNVLTIQGKHIEMYDKLTAHLTAQLRRTKDDSSESTESKEPDLLTSMISSFMAGKIQAGGDVDAIEPVKPTPTNGAAKS